MSKTIEQARALLGNNFSEFSDEQVLDIANDLEQLSYITYDIVMEQQRKNKSLGNSEGLLPERGA